MAQLSNTADATGLYNGISTSLTDTLVIQLVEGLTLTKTADQASWAAGNLTYTLTIDNTSALPYTGVVITDVLDPAIIKLVEGSVTINGSKAALADYTYDDVTGLLTIDPVTPLDVADGGSAVIAFQVEQV